MRFPTILLLIAACVLVILPDADGAGDGSELAVPFMEPAPERVEADRVRAHLAMVEAELRARDVSELPDEVGAARQKVLGWLAEYRAAGTFPHNHTHPEERVPVFVDSHGTPCAVGYLLLRSGEAELVGDVVQADNNVRIHELSEDARLGEWLEMHGLTLDEAARIQPMYGGCGFFGCEEPEPEPSIAHYKPMTLGLAGLTGGAMTWGLMAERTASGVDWPAWVVLGAGVTDGIHAWRGIGDGQEPWAIGVNLLASVGGAAVGLHRLLSRDTAPGALDRSAVEVTPWVTGDRGGFALRWRR